MQSAGGEVSEGNREITLLLARFVCNNHTICDAELQPVGVGIYPLAALLNHSCTCAPRTVSPGLQSGLLLPRTALT